MGTAESNITSNDTDIATNASAITTLQSQMTTAQSDITTNATNIATKQATITTTSGTITAQALTTRVGNHDGGNVSVDVRKLNTKYVANTTTAVTAEPGASLLNVVTPSSGTTTVTLPDTLSQGDILSVYHNGGTGTLTGGLFVHRAEQHADQWQRHLT